MTHAGYVIVSYWPFVAISWTSACQVPFETKERMVLEDKCFAIFSYVGSSEVRSSQRIYDNVNSATAMHRSQLG